MRLSGLRNWLVGRMPTSQQLAAVYGVIVLVVYGWTIYWFLYQLPSWLYFLTLGEILVSFAYAMAVNFLESILVLAVPVFIGFILPPRWFREQFVAQGTSLVVLSLLALMQYLGAIIAVQKIPSGIGRVALLVIAAILLLVFIIGRIGFLCKGIEEIANRAIIFLYIFMPISMISILVVIVRNFIEALHG